MKGYFANEWLYCSFEFKKKTSVRVVDGSKVKTLTFDFDKKKYFLLLARGNSVECKSYVKYFKMRSPAYTILQFQIEKISMESVTTIWEQPFLGRSIT